MNLVLVAGRPKSSFSEVTSGELMTELEDARHPSSSIERNSKISTVRFPVILCHPLDIKAFHQSAYWPDFCMIGQI